MGETAYDVARMETREIADGTIGELQEELTGLTDEVSHLEVALRVVLSGEEPVPEKAIAELRVNRSELHGLVQGIRQQRYRLARIIQRIDL